MVKVKGTSRRIVEIKGGYGSCFERAIFFVRRDVPRNTPESTLTQEATHIIEKFCAEMEAPRSRFRSRLRQFLLAAGACAAGACAVLLCRAIGGL